MIFFKQTVLPDAPIRPFDLSDRGFLLSDGVFDTSLVRKGDIVLKDAHLERLASDCHALGLPWPGKLIQDHIGEIERSGHSGALRITITRGPAQRGLAAAGDTAPTLLVRLSSFDTALQGAALSLQTSSIRRNETSPTSRHKTLAYLDNILAGQAARAAGFDDALFLNTTGQVCCTSMGNLFALSGDTLHTPPIADGVLPGIMRKWVIDTAPIHGLQVRETRLSREDLIDCEQVFMTNSLRLACPITRIDEHVFPGQLPKAVASAIQARFGAAS